ncbi:hypothetical protein J6590_031925 [Homalodisca vitripennis]|nr:hypothetical protein J6590_031925 [Homalodisca vitripennis]
MHNTTGRPPNKTGTVAGGGRIGKWMDSRHRPRKPKTYDFILVLTDFFKVLHSISEEITRCGTVTQWAWKNIPEQERKNSTAIFKSCDIRHYAVRVLSSTLNRPCLL